MPVSLYPNNFQMCLARWKVRDEKRKDFKYNHNIISVWKSFLEQPSPNLCPPDVLDCNAQNSWTILLSNQDQNTTIMIKKNHHPSLPLALLRWRWRYFKFKETLSANEIDWGESRRKVITQVGIFSGQEGNSPSHLLLELNISFGKGAPA